MFKGVFAYHLGRLIDALPEGAERAELLGWAQRNGEAVWRTSADGTRPISGSWSGPYGQVGAAAQASGIDILLAASS